MKRTLMYVAGFFLTTSCALWAAENTDPAASAAAPAGQPAVQATAETAPAPATAAGQQSFLTQAFVAAKEVKMDDARTLFAKAGDQARAGRDWKSLVDAGTGLSNLGNPEKAREYFDAAYDLAIDGSDWQKLVGTGFALLTLPRSMGADERARRCFVRAGKAALDRRDWKGMVQTGNGLLAMGEKERAKQFYDQAFDGVRAGSDPAAVSELEECYTALHDYGKMDECRRLLDKSGSAYSKPLDLSVDTEYKPEAASLEKQRAINDAARQEIASRDAYIMEKEKQKERLYTGYYSYYGFPDVIWTHSGYYGSAYSVRRPWRKCSDQELVIWASYRLGH